MLSVMLPPKNVHLKGLSSRTHMMANVAGKSRAQNVLAFDVFAHRGG